MQTSDTPRAGLEFQHNSEWLIVFSDRSESVAPMESCETDFNGAQLANELDDLTLTSGSDAPNEQKEGVGVYE